MEEGTLPPADAPRLLPVRMAECERERTDDAGTPPELAALNPGVVEKETDVAGDSRGDVDCWGKALDPPLPPWM